LNALQDATIVSLVLFEMVPLSEVSSNQNRDSNLLPNEDSNSLFETLANWNVILEGLAKSPTGNATDKLPQSKKPRSSPPVRRRHKKMGGAA
jgi:hypothetical protein